MKCFNCKAALTAQRVANAKLSFKCDTNKGFAKKEQERYYYICTHCEALCEASKHQHAEYMEEKGY